MLKKLQSFLKRKKIASIFLLCWFQGSNKLILLFSELSASAVKQHIFNNNDLNLKNNASQDNEGNVTDLSSVERYY